MPCHPSAAPIGDFLGNLLLVSHLCRQFGAFNTNNSSMYMSDRLYSDVSPEVDQGTLSGQ